MVQLGKRTGWIGMGVRKIPGITLSYNATARFIISHVFPSLSYSKAKRGRENQSFTLRSKVLSQMDTEQLEVKNPRSSENMKITTTLSPICIDLKAILEFLNISNQQCYKA